MKALGAAVRKALAWFGRWPPVLRVMTGVVGGLFVIAAGLTVLSAGSTSAPGAGSGRRGTAPTFSVPDLRDPAGRVELGSHPGRPVVLNFWASWCVPCRREMPIFEDAHRKAGDRIAFIGIDHRDGRTPARDLLAQTGVTYPSGYDPDGKVAAAYELVGMPSTVFISPEGQILTTRRGEMTRTELEDTIERLFG